MQKEYKDDCVFYIEIYFKKNSNTIKENNEGLEGTAFCNWNGN